jgi:tripartite ATP-independent transporter DctP family solute receptor
VILAVLSTIFLSGVFAGGRKEAASGTAEKQSVKTEVIKFSSPQAPDHPATIGALKFAEIVNNESGGRLKAEVFPANQLGNIKDVIEYTMVKSVHMYIGGAGELSVFQPEFGVLDCPFLFRDYDHLMKATESEAVVEMSGKLEKSRGVKILSAQYYYGTRHLTTSKKAIRTPEDLKGMLIRVPAQPIYLETMKAMGATPTPVAFSDLYMALKQGVVDGQENPIPTIYANKYYESQKFINLTGHIMQSNLIGANASWYNGLPEDLKKVVDKGIREAVKLNNALTLQKEKELLDELKKQGMTVIQPDIEAFRAATKEIPGKFEDKWGKGAAERISAVK